MALVFLAYTANPLPTNRTVNITVLGMTTFRIALAKKALQNPAVLGFI
jgi:hypothetical protein